MRNKTIGVLVLSVLLMGAGLALGEGAYGPAIPGSTEGVGTFFTVSGSNFLDVSVTSSVPVQTYILSQDEVVEICLGKNEAGSADLTVAGLVPGVSYYLYKGDLAARERVTAGADGSVAFAVDLTAPNRVLLKVKPSTVFLADSAWTDGAGVVHPEGFSNSDGGDLNGVVGTWDPATRIAAMVADLADILDIRSSNLVLEGNGHTISGGRGINIGSRSYGVGGNITIRNLNFVNCAYSIYEWATRGIIVSHCNFTNSNYGVYYQWGSGGGVVENCTFQGGYGAVSFNFVCGGAIVRNNTISGMQSASHILMWSGSNTYEGNRFIGNNIALQIYGDWSTFTGNTFENNTTAVSFSEYPGWDYPVNNTFTRNNFVNNTTQVVNGMFNVFSGDAETGGNFWSDWTTPNLDGDRYVDIPYDIRNSYGEVVAQDLYPWALRDGWLLLNLPPFFDAVGAKEVSEYQLVTFVVTATDPEGLPVALRAENLPAGAAFDPATGIFSWRPTGSQAGIYTVSFFATDAGTPAMTAQMDVIITVGAVTSPTQLNQILIQEITNATLPTPDLGNSYSASLKKVDGFVQSGQVTAAKNQIEAFIQKTRQDLAQGKLDPALGDLWIIMAQDILALMP